MHNKKISTIITALLLSLSLPTTARVYAADDENAPVQAHIGNIVELGVGARAMAFAGNQVATVNNLSAVYWNPAALAFMPVREAHIAFDMFRIYGEPRFDESRIVIPPGARLGGHTERLRMTSIGVVHAIPTTRGGLSVAFSRDKPVMFDYFTNYTYRLDDVTTQINNMTRGDLNRWSGALGIQLAPNIAAGVTLSYITDSEDGRLASSVWSDNPGFTDGYDYDVRIDCDVEWGFAAVFGVMFMPADNLKIGARVNAFRTLRLVDMFYFSGYDGEGDYAYAHSAPSGSIGAEYKLPWATVTADLRLTMPYTFSTLPVSDIARMPSDVQAGRYKAGGGLGIEVPLPAIPVVLRAGYSLDAYDLYPFIFKYDGWAIDWNGMGRGAWPSRNRHTAGLGFGVFTTGVGFELSYSYQTWGIRSDRRGNEYWYNWYGLDNSSHRVMTAFTYRY